MSLSHKIIAITGGASGIGLATAKLLASRGAKLALADTQEKNLLAIQDELAASGTEVHCTVVDVRKRADVDAWAQKTVQKFGNVDGVVTCAGVSGSQALKDDIQDIDDDDWDFVFDVNIKGTMNTLRAFIPSINNGGSIVTIASVAGVSGIPKNAAYVASKHAVVGLSRTATMELGPRNIRVNCVCPGLVETPMTAVINRPGTEVFKDLAPLRRKGQPGEIAGAIAWLLSDDASYVTGTTQIVDGGFHNK